MKLTAIVALAAAFFVTGCSNCCPPIPSASPGTAPATPTRSRLATDSPGPTISPAITVSPTVSATPSAVASINPTAQPPAADKPGRCAEADLIFDPALNELLLVNCTTFSGGPKNLTVWGWNGDEWHVVTSGPAPARVVGGAALDTDRGALTVYGGYVPDTDPCSTETWTWDGADWAQAETSPPPACDHNRMVYDPAEGTTLLMGGQDGRGVAVDGTWTWNGSAFAQSDAMLPPSRAHFGLAYDPNHEQVLLYGGLTRTSVMGDFWAYHESQWLPLELTDPGTRSHIGMVYDTKRDELLIFGGATAEATFASLTDDMWLLEDGAWQQLQPAATPGARGGASLGYDPGLDQVVLYGGFDSTGNELDDTWLWDGKNWSCAANCP